LLWFSLVSSAGCLSLTHPIRSVPCELLEPCQNVPQCSRGQVYVFLVNGIDPLNCANLTGVRDYLHQLGFSKTYYGQLYHGPRFTRELRRLHLEDPEARFVLIGFSMGANVVQRMAEHARNDGILVDLAVYLDRTNVFMDVTNQPENIDRVVNVVANDCFCKAKELANAENIKLSDIWHFGAPTHRQVLEMLARELTMVSAGVPIVHVSEPAPFLDPDAASTPRALPPAASAEHDAWDFLKPRPIVNAQPSTEGRRG